MKRCLLFLIFLCGLNRVSAQDKWSALIQKADIILQGKVLAVTPQRLQDNIYSTIQIQPEVVYKGAVPSVFEFKQLGGELDGFVVLPSHQPEFSAGEEVLLFYNQKTQSVVEGEAGKWQIQNGKLSALGISKQSLQTYLRRLIAAPVSQHSQILQGLTAVQLIAKRNASISSFLPTKGASGIGTLVTIEGSGFGATRGAGKVEFVKSEDTWLEATIVTWVDSRIRVLVPFGAGTGAIQITAADGSVIQTPTPFEVSFGSAMRKWGGKTVNVPYRINPNTPDIANQAEINGITAAINTWNAVNSNLQFSYIGQTTTTTEVANSINEIFWKPIDGMGGVLARNTIYYYKYSGTIVESDIAFDEAELWSLNPDVSQMDVESVALHELGHSVFLNDLWTNDDASKVMHAALHGGQLKRTLHADDILGIQTVCGPEIGANSLGGNASLNSTAAIAYAEDAAQFAVGQGDNTFTLEAWIKPATAPIDFGLIAGQTDFATQRASELVLRSDRKIEFRISVNGTAVISLTSTQVVPLNVWTHVRAVLLKSPSSNSRYLALYFNGVLDLEGSGGTASLFNSTARFYVGGILNGTEGLYAFPGQIDEVRLSNIPRIFSVLSIVKHGVPFSFDTDVNTLGLWKLDELVNVAKTSSLSRYLDHSGIANNDLQVQTISLAIGLTAFELRKENGHINIVWRVAQIDQVQRFEVEYKNGEAGYLPIGDIAANGLSYALSHENAFGGLHTYRIKAYLKDGSVQYSEPRQLLVELPNAYEMSAVYPNPTHQFGQFKLVLAQSQKIEVVVYDILGRIVLPTQSIDADANTLQTIQVNLEGLSSGNYYVQVKGNDILEHLPIQVIR